MLIDRPVYHGRDARGPLRTRGYRYFNNPLNA